MRSIIAVALLISSAFVAAFAAPLKNIVVFGDSLSDNGNLYNYMDHRYPQSPPYYQGRFSNGPVWVEQLAASYFPENADAHLQDYAYGGAEVFEGNDDGFLLSLENEIGKYLLVNPQIDPDNLFIVWIGANNYLDAPSDIDKTVAEVNEGIEHSLVRLVNAGARHILVLNLPDLGKTPAAREYDVEDVLSKITVQHNQALAASLSQLQNTYPDVQWLSYDVGQLVNDIVASPAQYGFNNTTDTCYKSTINPKQRLTMLSIATGIQKGAKSQDDNCSGYLFFDGVHPTAPAHQIMANIARKLLDDAGITFVNDSQKG